MPETTRMTKIQVTFLFISVILICLVLYFKNIILSNILYCIDLSLLLLLLLLIL